MASQKLLWAFTPLVAASLVAGERPAQAILNYYIYENTGNVIVETAGSLNLPSPIGGGSCGLNGMLLSSSAVICTGVDKTMNSYALQAAAGFGGVASLFLASVVSGISTSLQGNEPRFSIDPLYVNNDPIVSSATFNGGTLAGLGFSSPGLIGTWTLTATNDTINVFVGAPPAPTAVPGTLPLFVAAAAFCYSRRLRRRVSLSRSTSPSATSISS